MEMRIRFPGNKRVNAEFDGYTVATDQPVDGGGEASAPAPFDLFLASIGTCAGIFVLGFCQKRGISTDGLELLQKMEWDPVKHLVSKIKLEIQVPKDFPEKYRESLIKAASLCTVKRHMHEPPEFEVVTEVKE
ncbi:MAG TPA: osmotically inducible protein OsmC [Bdellovibrionales bacterium]|nr:MAG: osmotically inducible protein OsmC [Bdellovibrionales bacterium GWB1_52_6]OFZ05519.1 MAG: osmotically inducible protein OsmC [Bdellovibrionales bacterium GWA1_52_35]OFZ42178.1 MAG: osmotically inducible protein OsmC [Bdellovibrionales bacterium GWC1_52_8]HAR42814.1 osmotically inducible protein OsmC [Bdellovibrionales bacterium]HCM39115.1 osmotically inducible protein OsmC [Bdellovibrionales bacterium]